MFGPPVLEDDAVERPLLVFKFLGGQRLLSHKELRPVPVPAFHANLLREQFHLLLLRRNLGGLGPSLGLREPRFRGGPRRFGLHDSRLPTIPVVEAASTSPS